MDTKIDKIGEHRPNSGRPKSVSKRIQVCLYLRPEVADRLKQMAKEQNTKVGRMVEGIIAPLMVKNAPSDFEAEKWLEFKQTTQKVILIKED